MKTNMNTTTNLITFTGAVGTAVFGLTKDEWQVVGVLAGIGIGLLGWGTNALFHWLRYRRGQ